MNLQKAGSLLILLLLSSSLLNSAHSSAEKSYLFGVFPYLSPLRMDEIYAPISQELSKNLGQRVKFRTSSNLPNFREKLQSEYYDFAIVQPVFYPLAVDQAGYIPLVKMEGNVSSVIVVLANSPLKSVRDLKGKKIATPPVFGPVVTLAKRSLVENGISPDTDVSFKTNKTVGACFQKILVGLADACIAPDFAVKPFEQSMGVKFRTLLRSQAVPNQALVVHPRIPVQVQNRIKQTLLSWRYSAQGKKLLQSLNSKGFVEVNDSDYDSVRSFVRDMNQ